MFEADFLECSYGFRPGCNPHGALRALRHEIIVTKKVGHLFEADIRGYFNHIQHEWLQKMVAHRIGESVHPAPHRQMAERRFMVGGVVTRTEAGSPRAGQSARSYPISTCISFLISGSRRRSDRAVKERRTLTRFCRRHAGTDINLMGCKSPDPNRPFGDLAGGRVGGAEAHGSK